MHWLDDTGICLFRAHRPTDWRRKDIDGKGRRGGWVCSICHPPAPAVVERGEVERRADLDAATV